ncbi:MAG: ABC transporter substrate-binding protein [Gaiellaceae bacterium MAG52_C11]|nr:ABC transporter substrate-binding protein [Candidatus Gaiellasilicea maunaloa]
MFRRFTHLVLLALASLLLAACMSDSDDEAADTSGTATTESSEEGPSDDAVLRVAFFADMVTVDPDVFYDIEGDAVMLALYDGLLRYKSDSTELEGALAESWEESDDGLTFTFTLRSDAKFSDATPVTSKLSRRASSGGRQWIRVRPTCSGMWPGMRLPTTRRS